jgi:hypothetical protein
MGERMEITGGSIPEVQPHRRTAISLTRSISYFSGMLHPGHGIPEVSSILVARTLW